MRVIVAGPRTVFSVPAVCEALTAARETLGVWPTVLVCGQATGVDTTAAEVCHFLGIDIDPYPITEEDRIKFGLRAGIERNNRMLSNAQALVAVWDGTSPGTWDMINRMVHAGLPAFVGMLHGHHDRNDINVWQRRAKPGMFCTRQLSVSV